MVLIHKWWNCIACSILLFIRKWECNPINQMRALLYCWIWSRPDRCVGYYHRPSAQGSLFSRVLIAEQESTTSIIITISQQPLSWCHHLHPLRRGAPQYPYYSCLHSDPSLWLNSLSLPSSRHRHRPLIPSPLMTAPPAAHNCSQFPPATTLFI